MTDTPEDDNQFEVHDLKGGEDFGYIARAQIAIGMGQDEHQLNPFLVLHTLPMEAINEPEKIGSTDPRWKDLFFLLTQPAAHDLFMDLGDKLLKDEVWAEIREVLERHSKE
jgi:hypothetical protein